MVPRSSRRATTRLVRFETGSTVEANEASSAGRKASSTGSSPWRDAMRTYSGVRRTTAASRLNSTVTRPASTQRARRSRGPASTSAATVAKKPSSSSRTASGTARTRKARGGPRLVRASSSAERGTIPVATATAATAVATTQAGMRLGATTTPATPVASATTWIMLVDVPPLRRSARTPCDGRSTHPGRGSPLRALLAFALSIDDFITLPAGHRRPVRRPPPASLRLTARAARAADSAGREHPGPATPAWLAFPRGPPVRAPRLRRAGRGRLRVRPVPGCGLVGGLRRHRPSPRAAVPAPRRDHGGAEGLVAGGPALGRPAVRVARCRRHAGAARGGPGRSRRPAVVIDLPLPPPAPVGDAAVAAVDGASLPPPLPLVAVPAWTPTFVADDDLGGVLNATSPLLSRAFGRVKGSGTRARPPSA